MERDSFVINIMDPADVSAKLVHARRILKDKEDRLAEVRDLERQVQEWRGTVEFLESRAPEDTVPQMSPQPFPQQSRPNQDGRRDVSRVHDLVVEVVNREVRKIRAKEVHGILTSEGYQLAPSSVSNALHYAAHRAKPPVIKDAQGRGMYAPLAYVEPEPVDSASPPQPQAMVIRARPWREGWPTEGPATPVVGG